DAPERWLDLRWDVEDRTPQRFPARIVLQTVNEPGSLAQVAQVIAEHDGNIDNISMERSSPDFTSVTIDLEVFDIKHLTSITAQLRAKDVVAAAERVNAGGDVAGGASRQNLVTRPRPSADWVARGRIGCKIMSAPHLRLGVNVDHVATIRNARGGRH